MNSTVSFSQENINHNNSHTMKRIILLLIISFWSLFAIAQIDREFWFAAPYASEDHGPNNTTPAHIYNPGGQPVSITVASFDMPVSVTISIPRNPAFVPLSFKLQPNSIKKIPLTNYMQFFIPNVKDFDFAQNIGIHIEADANITAYYEIEAVLNPDIFPMKGKNALGTLFYLPTQNKWYNDNRHDIGKVLGKVDEARSYAFIVASEDRTKVTITPSANLENGYPAGVTYDKMLDKGQVYVVQAEGYKDTDHIGGTKIISDKPIAVTIGDDSMYEQAFDACPDSDNWRFEDYNGDQIVPVNLLGHQYIVMRSKVFFNGASHPYTCTGKENIELHEHVFITAVSDNTKIFINGSTTATTTLQSGKQYALDISKNEYTLIETLDTTKKIYVYHLGGIVREMGGAILPPVNKCTGSYQIGFARNTGYKSAEEFTMNIMVRSGGEKTFLIDNNQTATNSINTANFTPIGTTGWSVAKIEFSVQALDTGQHLIKNTIQPFHMGIIGSTAHDWDGNGARLMGANYGFFSGYDEIKQEAYISLKNGNYKSVTVTPGTPVQLIAEGGYSYNWHALRFDTVMANNDTIWESMTSPYNLNYTNKYNPIASGLVEGNYKYLVDIKTQGCGSDTTIPLYINVKPPFIPINIEDTVCAYPADTKCSNICYKLSELTDTMYYKKPAGYNTYIESWNTKEVARPINFDTVGQWVAVGGSTLSQSTALLRDTINTNHVRKFDFTSATTPNNCGQFTINITNAANYINLSQTPSLSFDVYQLFNKHLESENPRLTVTVQLRDNNNNVVSATNTIDIPMFDNTQIYKNFWKTLNFNFGANGTGFNTITVSFVNSNGNGSRSGFIANR
ncbi:MAG: IgGFc-binding protein [Bacteroidales bacterium]|nr:IgGFc-binding protein [Bacteroidales bacterium]